MRVELMGTKIELPMFRDATGVSRIALTLPKELYGPIGDLVLDALVERGLAVRRTVPIEAVRMTPRRVEISGLSRR
jgi:hypothetical protein